MTLHKNFLSALARDLTEWEALREDYPLATIRLWHREGWGAEHGDGLRNPVLCDDGQIHRWRLMPPDRVQCELCDAVAKARRRTSQREAVAAMARHRTGYTEGGNRSGKSYSTLVAFVALALGSDHPAARAFWRGNGIDPDAFPKGPANAIHNDGEVWIVAISSGDSLIYHRQQVKALLQPGTYVFRGERSRGPAELEIWCPGYDYPAIIRFKSDDQGRQGAQGAKCRGILHDEEGKTSEVWDECGTRLTDTNGWHWLANTPIHGMTWVNARLVEKTSPDAEHDCVVMRIHSPDNPHLDVQGLRRLMTGDPTLQLAKMYGLARPRTGLVYPGWDPSIHVTSLDAETLDGWEEWPRYCALDFGARHNSCCLWGAVGPDGLLVVYRELYVSGLTTPELARRILEAEGARWVEERELEPGETVPPDLRYLVDRRGDRAVLAGHWDYSEAEVIVRRWGDPSARQTIRDLRSHEIVVTKANRDWLVGVSAVADRLALAADGRPRMVVLPGAAPNLCREISTLAYPDSARRDAPPPRPPGGDDATDTLRYLCAGLRHA